VFLITDARKHMKDIGMEFKAGPTYTKHTIMGKEFDASKADAYLKSFAISKA
jgi:nitrate/nitrite transport system substrate-binding protein